MHKQLDQSWKGWVKENLGLGIQKLEIAKILMQHRFDTEAIKAELGLPDLFRNCPVKIDPSKIESLPGVIRLHPSFNIFEIRNFVDTQQCKIACDLIRLSANPSTVGSDKEISYDASRTSMTAYFQNPGVDFSPILAIEDKIQLLTGIELLYSEPIQGQWYKPGQEFKQHFDAFTPEKETVQYYGNRPWTAMVYLNDVEEGGATGFPNIGQAMNPVAGKLILWQNTNDGIIIPESSHAGEPVIKGEKFILTKWFREKEWPYSLPRK
jgi:prolyl 4-hydroxylase